MSFFTILLILILIAVLVWNFVPAVRERMRGLTTVLEAIMAFVAYYGGMLNEALQEAQAAGVIPEGLEKFIPALFFGWIIFKRVITKTAVGKKKADV